MNFLHKQFSLTMEVTVVARRSEECGTTQISKEKLIDWKRHVKASKHY